jgi:hypothetical protein
MFRYSQHEQTVLRTIQSEIQSQTHWYGNLPDRSELLDFLASLVGTTTTTSTSTTTTNYEYEESESDDSSENNHSDGGNSDSAPTDPTGVSGNFGLKRRHTVDLAAVLLNVYYSPVAGGSNSIKALLPAVLR